MTFAEFWAALLAVPVDPHVSSANTALQKALTGEKENEARIEASLARPTHRAPDDDIEAALTEGREPRHDSDALTRALRHRIPWRQVVAKAQAAHKKAVRGAVRALIAKFQPTYTAHLQAMFKDVVSLAEKNAVMDDLFGKADMHDLPILDLQPAAFPHITKQDVAAWARRCVDLELLPASCLERIRGWDQ